MLVDLVSMPWHSLQSPCLPIGILKQTIERHFSAIEVRASHSYVTWADFVIRHGLTVADYQQVAETGIFHGIGDWVFCVALYSEDTVAMLDERFARYCVANELDPVIPARFRDLAETFVADLADRIAEHQPAILGLSSTFMQNVASLALMKAVKERSPATMVVIGGGNCDGVMGEAIFETFEFVDAVVSGEGESRLCEIVEAVAGGQRVSPRPGLLVRGADAHSCGTDPGLSDPKEWTLGRFGEYFEELSSTAFADDVSVVMQYEASRGCWWGERRHCTFCGLNGTSMEYRAKAGNIVVRELAELYEEYGVGRVNFVDNILDRDAFRTFLPELAAGPRDLTLQFEVKSNLSRAELQLLADAGTFSIQPGIESLSTKLLRTMRKGCTAVTNLVCIRDAREVGIHVTWNLLYGFPGEAPADYDFYLENWELWCHLDPPESLSRIALERFSPYFDDEALGFQIRRPARFYRHIYPYTQSTLMRLAYVFDTPDRGISGSVVRELREVTAQWRSRRTAGASLSARRVRGAGGGTVLMIDDLRDPEAPLCLMIDDLLDQAVLDRTSRGVGVESLRSQLSGSGLLPSMTELDESLDRLCTSKLLVRCDDRFVSLLTFLPEEHSGRATTADPDAHRSGS